MPRAEIRRRRANQNDEEAGSRTETIADFEDRKKVTSELNQALRPHQAGGGGVSSIPFLPMLGVMLLYSVLHSGVFHSSTIALAVGVVSAIVTQILAGKCTFEFIICLFIEFCVSEGV
jgi:hypothetical protein